MLDPHGRAGLARGRRSSSVSDLHLEKGIVLRALPRAACVPPWDTHAITLDRLTLLLRRWQPPHGSSPWAIQLPRHARAPRAWPATELPPVCMRDDRRRRSRFIWVLGNHDPHPPEGVGWRMGRREFATEGPLTVPPRRRCRAPQPGEIVRPPPPQGLGRDARRGRVSRPCFVTDQRRLMMPAFGAYTGGLDVSHPAIARLFPRGGRAFLLGQERLFSFTLAQLRGVAEAREAG